MEEHRAGWHNVIGQDRARGILERAIATGRVAHAYLLHGPDGVGKRAVALAFAQALQCTGPGLDPCGACEACHKVGHMLHPDVHVLFPHPKDASTEDIAERLRLLGEQPYEELDYVRRPSLSDAGKSSNRQVTYSVDRIKEELRRAMSFKSHEGRYKMAILIDADAMHPAAANAFLKLLEEPAPQTVFLLTTARVDRLLPTILSRCQRIRLDVLEPERIERALREAHGLEPDRAAMVARMADGSFARALQLVSNPLLQEHRALVLDFFRLVYVRPTDRLVDTIENLASHGREQAKGILQLMLQWVRDLVLYRATGSDARLVNVDQREAVARFCDNVAEADLDAMAGLIEEATDLLTRNVHQLLVFTVLADGLHAAMHGRPIDGLYRPLAEPAALAV